MKLGTGGYTKYCERTLITVRMDTIQQFLYMKLKFNFITFIKKKIKSSGSRASLYNTNPTTHL
jgi:hypothetical protein